MIWLVFALIVGLFVLAAWLFLPDEHPSEHALHDDENQDQALVTSPESSAFDRWMGWANESQTEAPLESHLQNHATHQTDKGADGADGSDKGKQSDTAPSAESAENSVTQQAAHGSEMATSNTPAELVEEAAENASAASLGLETNRSVKPDEAGNKATAGSEGGNTAKVLSGSAMSDEQTQATAESDAVQQPSSSGNEVYYYFHPVYGYYPVPADQSQGDAQLQSQGSGAGGGQMDMQFGFGGRSTTQGQAAPSFNQGGFYLPPQPVYP